MGLRDRGYKKQQEQTRSVWLTVIVDWCDWKVLPPRDDFCTTEVIAKWRVVVVGKILLFYAEPPSATCRKEQRVLDES